MIQGPVRTKQLINPQVQSKGRVVVTMSPGRGTRQKASPTQRQGLLSVPRLSNFHKKESSFLVQQQGGLFSSLSPYSSSYPLILYSDVFLCLPPQALRESTAHSFSCHGGNVVLWQHEKPCWGLKKRVDFYSEALRKKNEYIVGTPCGSLGLGSDGGPACETLSPGAVP